MYGKWTALFCLRRSEDFGELSLMNLMDGWFDWLIGSTYIQESQSHHLPYFVQPCAGQHIPPTHTHQPSSSPRPHCPRHQQCLLGRLGGADTLSAAVALRDFALNAPYQTLERLLKVHTAPESAGEGGGIGISLIPFPSFLFLSSSLLSFPSFFSFCSIFVLRCLFRWI